MVKALFTSEQSLETSGVVLVFIVANKHKKHMSIAVLVKSAIDSIPGRVAR